MIFVPSATISPSSSLLKNWMTKKWPRQLRCFFDRPRLWLLVRLGLCGMDKNEYRQQNNFGVNVCESHQRREFPSHFLNTFKAIGEKQKQTAEQNLLNDLSTVTLAFHFPFNHFALFVAGMPTFADQTFADSEIKIVLSQYILNVPDLYTIRFVLMLAFELAQKNENPMPGHKVMAKKLRAGREIWKSWVSWP